MAINDFTVGGSVCACVCGRLLALAGACLLATTARADLVVPTSAQISLGPGIVDLSCTDLVVGGTLQVAGGSLKNIRNVTIQPGGSLDGGSGLIEVAGNWSNSGSFTPGTATVNFRELCGAAPATISGNNTFFRASFVSTVGRNYIFSVGSTQTISSVLEISGTTSNPIQFRSSTPGQVAFIDLPNSGSQLIQHVGVTDAWATGQWLAPFQTNEGGGGNAKRWFGTPTGGGGSVAPAPVPALEPHMLAALCTLLAAIGAFLSRHRRTSKTATRAPLRDEDSP